MNAPLTQTASASISAALPEAWVERLFGRMSGMYGSKFADLWRSVDITEVKATWAEGLAGYTGEEIAKGLAACLTRDWPPTLPEFVKLCRPPIDAESAWLEAQEQMARREDGRDKWSHPAVYWSAVQFGHFELRNQPWERAKPRWCKLLDENMANRELPPVPPRAAALPAPGQTTTTKAEAQEHLAKIARKLTGGDGQVARLRESESYIAGLRHNVKHGKGNVPERCASILTAWGYSVEEAKA